MLNLQVSDCGKVQPSEKAWAARMEFPDFLLLWLFISHYESISTIAKTWKQPKCPSTDEWIKKCYIHIMEYNSAIKKNEIKLFATTWLDLEIVILSEVSQTEKDKYHM